MKRLLVACEFSGVVREAFRARGWDAWSCDLLPAADGSSYHLQGDVLSVLGNGWDMMIAHPPCTFLCASGLHWNGRGRGTERTEQALTFVRALMDAPIDRICVENPVGAIGSRIRPADQYIQPHQFGEDASKRTGLWLKGIPLLVPTQRIPGRVVNGRERWSNQTDSGQNRLGPSDQRWAERSVTYLGIANAMAEQWSCVT